MQSTDPYSTSTSLLLQLRRGEQPSWFRLVRAYTPLIELWSRQQGIRGVDTEDIVQNVFAAVAQHIDEFGRDRSENSFRAWLWTIARSKIADHFRSTQKGPKAIGGERFFAAEALNPQTEARSSSDAVDDRQVLIANALQVIRRDFSQQTWNAFWLTTALGQRTNEVALQLGMTAAAVCMCRARVMRRLRETIDS